MGYKFDDDITILNKRTGEKIVDAKKGTKLFTPEDQRQRIYEKKQKQNAVKDET